MEQNRTGMERWEKEQTIQLKAHVIERETND